MSKMAARTVNVIIINLCVTILLSALAFRRFNDKREFYETLEATFIC